MARPGYRQQARLPLPRPIHGPARLRNTTTTNTTTTTGMTKTGMTKTTTGTGKGVERVSKRRKRTNTNVPAKGRLRDIADRLWSIAVKGDWAHRCAVCARTGDLNSHHLIPRQHQTTRYDLRNGVCLCRRCHQFCPDYSPHQNAAGFMGWLEVQCPASHEWYTKTVANGDCRQFNGTTNAAYYCDVIRSLREYVDDDDYARIVGQRFGAWLEQEDD